MAKCPDLDVRLFDGHVTLEPIGSLKPRKSNPRTHSAGQIRLLAKNIRKYGFIVPILVDEDHQVLAGHGRIEAAKQIGLNKVPTIQVQHLTEAQKRAFVIADNRLAELAHWDEFTLGSELESLADLNPEFDLTELGWEMAEIDMMIGALTEPEGEASAAAEPPIPTLEKRAVSKAGDLWTLGGHKVLVGDATKRRAYVRLLGRRRPRCVFTDPPYNVPIRGHVSGLGTHVHDEFAMASGEMTREEFTFFLELVFALMTEFTRDGSIHYICMDWRHLQELQDAAHGIYTELKNLCVWNKSNGGMGSFYRSKHELVFVFKNGPAPHINNFELGQKGRYRTNVWDYAGANSFGASRDSDLAMHPTVKPVQMVADALLDCTNRGDVVLDPFGGSGTTLMAAEQTGRRARLMELDPLYADVIVRRWQAYTGDVAIHAENGLKFTEMMENSNG